MSGQGYSIFHETMADMTYPEIEDAARRGAVVLWALGVIEEHGPHLPLATDVYVPCATLREARDILTERGIESVIAPPFYWGINAATAAFAGSFIVRPETMIELMKDVFRSLRKDGFDTVFCLSGHGDAAHNRVLYDGVKAGRDYGPIRSYMLVAPAFAKRFGFDLADPHLVLLEGPPDAPQQYVDVHAGNGETSMIWAKYPEVVRTDIVPTLAPTNSTIDDLMEWRKGDQHAVRATPHGYLGDPAAADPKRGHEIVHAEGLAIADAIMLALSSRAQSRDRR
jgi:creatinine amidohydrolase